MTPPPMMTTREAAGRFPVLTRPEIATRPMLAVSGSCASCRKLAEFALSRARQVAEALRRHAAALMKDRREMALSRETDETGNVRQRPIARAQQFLCPRDAARDHILPGRL